MLEGTVKKVRATSARRQSLDASHDDTLSMHAGNTSSTTSSEVTVLRPGVAAFLDAHGVGPGGATRSGGVQEVDPVVLLVCRPAPGEDVMAGLLALESEVKWRPMVNGDVGCCSEEMLERSHCATKLFMVVMTCLTPL